MRSFSSKKNNGFTLIETMFYVILISFVIVSLAGFQAFYKHKITNKMKKIITLHKVRNFMTASGSIMLSFKEKFPLAIVDCQKERLDITSDTGERMSLSWMNGQLGICWTKEDGQEHRRLFPCDVQDTVFRAVFGNGKKPTARNMDIVDIQISFGEKENMDFSIPLI